MLSAGFQFGFSIRIHPTSSLLQTMSFHALRNIHIALLRRRRHFDAIAHNFRGVGSARTFTTSTSATEHKVTLDNKTLYIDQSLAEALGWSPQSGSDAGIQLSMSTMTGWGPSYFTITAAGSDSGEFYLSIYPIQSY